MAGFRIRVRILSPVRRQMRCPVQGSALKMSLLMLLLAMKLMECESGANKLIPTRVNMVPEEHHSRTRQIRTLKRTRKRLSAGSDRSLLKSRRPHPCVSYPIPISILSHATSIKLHRSSNGHRNAQYIHQKTAQIHIMRINDGQL